MTKPLRIFISSPGDVVPERRRAQLVIEKLAKEYARFFIMEPVLWEVEPMLASGHFQDQIVPPGETDIVVLIVWSRLGTPLPEKTATRQYRGIDDRAPVTGTEWEFEDALAAQNRRGAPDVVAYRKQADPVVSLKDNAAMDAAKHQWDMLETFWSRWFIDRGQFRAAFNTFDDLDQFEARIESDLRRLIEGRIELLPSGERTTPAATWLSGSPFRGLETYRFEHAPIFFGRSAMTKAAVEMLSGNAEAGRGFLMILGASGAGKSSLAQAGVMPSLVTRGIIPSVGLWRRAMLRPGGHPSGPFAALAEALVADAALPELRASGQDAAALARHLKASADDPGFIIVSVLNQIEQSARQHGDLLKIETANLVVLVDQLEELFTATDIRVDERQAFIRCLDGLARSGRVAVLATMRSDYWHRASEAPQLVDMAAGNGRLDLLPPFQDEILEMIRQPAAAAGLAFEADPSREIRLDGTLASEAANEPGALPLLSFLLGELYKKDVGDTGRATLTYASMRDLGGLNGAIANRANAVFDAMPAEIQSALPKVLRALVTVDRAGAEPSARTALMARFAAGSPERRLVDALLDPRVRLLVAEGDDEIVQVRLAHEALLKHWDRARRQIAQDRDDLRTRALVEEGFAEWSKAAASRRRQYLLRDPLLAAAVDLAKRWGDEFDAGTLAFIEASRRRARLAQQLTMAAAAVFALVAIAAMTAGGMAYRANQIAEQQRVRAEANAAAAAAQRLVAEQNGRRASDERDRALVTESKVLADTARRYRQLNDQTRSALVALEGLPDSKAGIARPFVAEPMAQLYASLIEMRESIFLPTKISMGEGQRKELFSPNGQRFLTRNNDDGDLLWNLETGQVVADLAKAVGGKTSMSQFSPDGKRVAVAAGGPVRLFDTNDGKGLATLQIASSGGEVVFSPDSARVATGGWKAPIQVWNAETGNLEATADNSAELRPIWFSPDGAWLIGQKGPIIPTDVEIWDSRSGNKIGSVTGKYLGHSPDGAFYVTVQSQDRDNSDKNQSEPIFRVLAAHGTQVVSQFESLKGCKSWQIEHKFSSDNRSIILYCKGRVETWNLRSGAQTKALYKLGERDNAAFSPGGEFILTWSEADKIVRIQDTREERAWEFGKSERAYDLALSPDGKLVLVGDVSLLQVWEFATGARIASISGRQARFSADSKFVSTVSEEGVRIWDLNTDFQFSRHGDAVMAVGYTPDGKYVATREYDRVLVWSAETRHQVGSMDVKGGADNDGSDFMVEFNAIQPRLLVIGRDKGWLFDVTKGDLVADFDRVVDGHFSRDGKFFVLVSGGVARLYDAASGKEVRAFGGRSSSASFSPDGSLLVTTSGTLATIWDANSGTSLRTLAGHQARLMGASFSPDGKRVATGSQDRTARIWDVATGRQLTELSGHGATVLRATFTPDGKRVITASEDGTARIWDPETGKSPATLEAVGQPFWFTFTAISPDGRLVVTPGRNGVAHLWDIATGNEIAILGGHAGDLTSATFSPDGQTVVTTARERVVRLWPVVHSPQELIDAAKGALTRCLTAAERKAAFLDATPPDWCIEAERWPYNTQAWKDWLRDRRANLNPPLPDLSP